MRKDKKEALKLRRLGKSYHFIQTTLRIPKSTLSGWLHDHVWSQKIKETLIEKNKIQSIVRMRRLNTIRGSQLKKIYDEARYEAHEEFKKIKYDPIFISGVMIYWGEGEKTSKHMVKISNVDPLMITMFYKFLTNICNIEKHRIRASLLLYPDLNEKICKKYWKEKTPLKDINFNKSITIEGRHKTRRLKYGVCTIGTSSSYLKEKMMVWLKILPNALL